VDRRGTLQRRRDLITTTIKEKTMTTHTATHDTTTDRGALLERARELQARVTENARPLVLLGLRVLFGYALIRAGYGKLTNLEGVTQFFTGLGIPAPGASAALVGVAELGGGILLIAGLATRLAALALTGVLAVALFTAHTEELSVILSEPGTFIGAAPVPYLAALLVLAIFGAGSLSADHLILERGRRQ
jgi:putative oxidoreductase